MKIHSTRLFGPTCLLFSSKQSSIHVYSDYTFIRNTKANPGHLTNTLFEGYTDPLLNFPSLFSDWSMVQCVHIIDQSEKSEVVKLSKGALSKKEHYPAVMSKQGKRQNSRVDQCNLQKMYL